MAGIGGVTCDLVNGNPPRNLTERLGIWQIAGIDGYGIQAQGTGDSGFRFVAVKFGDFSAINAWIGNIEALKDGSIISIVDDRGITWDNLVITRVSEAETRARVNHDGLGSYVSRMRVEGLVVEPLA